LDEDMEPVGPDGEPIGRWVKGLNRSRKCFLYMHTHSREIRGVRPRGYEESDKEKAVAAKKEAQIDLHAAMLSCPLSAARRVALHLLQQGKRTPLIVAGSPEAHAELLDQFDSEFIVNTRPFALGPIRTKIKMPDAVENARKTLIAAAKAGQPCVIDVVDEAPMFMEKICGEQKYKRWFPKELFDGASVEWAKSIFKEADKTDGEAVVAEGFCVIVTTSLSAATYEKNLQGSFTSLWSKLQPLRIKESTHVEAIAAADLEVAIQRAVKEFKKVPLVLDSTPNEVANTYLKFQHTTTIESASLGEDMEAARRKLVIAMMAGHTLLIKLDASQPDLLGSLCTDSVFPVAVFQGGAIQLPEWTDRIVKPEDLQTGGSNGPADYQVGQSGVFFVRQEFRVVVTSSCSDADYWDKLGDRLPLWNLHVIKVDPDFV